MKQLFSPVHDLEQSYIRLTVMAALLVVSLFLTQAFWLMSDNGFMRSISTWVLSGSLLFHVGFFVLAIHTTRITDYRVHRDLIFPIVGGALADVVCLVINFAVFQNVVNANVSLLGIIPFMILLFEVHSVCRKIEHWA